jgi:hypothetical protein
VPGILHNSQQRRVFAGHGCSSKDDISKEDSDQAWQWSYFKGLLLQSYSRISGHQPERAYQTLKNKTISNKAYRYRLEKISVTGFVSPACLRCRLLLRPSYAGSLQIISFALKKGVPPETIAGSRSGNLLIMFLSLMLNIPV